MGEHVEDTRRRAELAAKYPPIRPVDNARRLGLPFTPLTDFYYWLLKARWSAVLGMFAAGFVLVNLVFAGLYLAGEGCIAGARPGSFADAFYFSVQSIATIGYGALTPANDYANMLVTAEAMIGLLITALSTGIVFAKFGRARANVRFTDKILFSPYDGRPSLYFRVANVRGNDVAEATVNVAVLKTHTTAEGHTLRRLHELPLVRSHTPMFRLSWLVIHVIDEDSPLHGMSLEDMYADRTMIVVSLMGMDSTFVQEVAARHIYQVQDFEFDHHFADIVSTLDDGRLQFDFTRFNSIRPLSEAELRVGQKQELEEELAEELEAEAEELCAVQEHEGSAAQ